MSPRPELNPNMLGSNLFLDSIGDVIFVVHCCCRLDMYIHDYMVRKNMHESAETFAAEANVCPPNLFAPDIADRTLPKPIENYVLPNVFPTMSPRPELNPNMLGSNLFLDSIGGTQSQMTSHILDIRRKK
ncbi:hypothetical protein ACJIZ3_006356 [Penstemon smallii]|uniref:Uncharacterized protein n=1 Tax=Penstemon smallii TaxID=265156 RepID=A0ABD3S7N7_9LAMI